jgi:hypothetical protein
MDRYYIMIFRQNDSRELPQLPRGGPERNTRLVGYFLKSIPDYSWRKCSIFSITQRIRKAKKSPNNGTIF